MAPVKKQETEVTLYILRLSIILKSNHGNSGNTAMYFQLRVLIQNISDCL